MASPPGAHRAASSRGALAPAPFPAAAHFASRAAGPFLRQQPHPGNSGGDDAVEAVDEGDDDEEDDGDEEGNLPDGGHCSSQQRCPSIPAIGRAAMNRGNGTRQIQEEQQWKHSHIYNCASEQYGHASPREDEPSTIPREMRVENGYEVIGRREGGPASSYWDLLRAHLSDPLTVQAFKREEESAKSLKRRRERLEKDKCGNDEPNPTEISRGKGVQFPFAVFDQVIIKDPRTICGTRSSCDSTVPKWMVCGEDLRQCREREVSVPFSGKIYQWR